jgi:hypothetical protein
MEAAREQIARGVSAETPESSDGSHPEKEKATDTHGCVPLDSHAV